MISFEARFVKLSPKKFSTKFRRTGKELFRPDEIRDLLQLKRVKTIYRWIRAGKIKQIRPHTGEPEENPAGGDRADHERDAKKIRTAKEE